jgi:hypothetical protein
MTACFRLFRILKELRRNVLKYIELFYNSQR